MQEAAERYELRSQAIADKLRNLLVAVNTGGIAVVLATASSLVEHGVPTNWAVPSVAAFVAGLCLVIASLFLQKGKALARRDAADSAEAAPDFDKFLHRNYTWDGFAFLAFVVGAVLALHALSGLSPGCT